MRIIIKEDNEYIVKGANYKKDRILEAILLLEEIEKLPLEEQLLIYFLMTGLKNKEIAEILHIQESNLCRKIKKMKEKIKKIWFSSTLCG